MSFFRKKLRIKKLPHFEGSLPTYATPASSGFDIRAQVSQPVVLKPGERKAVATGLCFEIPEGFELQIRPRSGLALKSGISLPNTPGTIDADYRGELKVIMVNLGQEDFPINNQDRIAQGVLCPVWQADFEIAEELSETSRGSGGFGSTGVQ